MIDEFEDKLENIELFETINTSSFTCDVYRILIDDLINNKSN